MPKKFNSLEEKRAYERECYAKSMGKYKDKAITRKKSYMHIASQHVWDFLKEHPCVDCGETDPVVLEFDHVRDKIQVISKLMKNGNCIETINKEIEKCEVRCANCHIRKTTKQFNWWKNERVNNRNCEEDS